MGVGFFRVIYKKQKDLERRDKRDDCTEKEGGFSEDWNAVNKVTITSV